MNAWTLICNHEYESALVILDEALRAAPRDYLLLANRATALLGLGLLERALEDFVLANELQARVSGGASSPYSEDIATLQWLIGEQDTAIRTLLAKIQGLRHGTVEFTDLAGGVGCGLLLWFMVARMESNDRVLYATEYLSSFLGGAKANQWPGPLARYLLEEVEFSEVLLCAGGSAKNSDVAQKARDDVLVRRRYCQSLFYEAFRMYLNGDWQGYVDGMIACSRLENPIIEREWYIARAEAARNEQMEW